MSEDRTDITKFLTKSFEQLDYDLKDLLDHKLADYDLSKTKVVSLLNIDKDTFEEIINGTAKQPSLINVIKIAHFLDLDINEVIPAILKGQTKENLVSVAKAKKATFIAKNFDLKKLTKAGFFTDSEDVDYLTNRLLDFFGYGSIYQFEKELIKPLYSRTKRTFSDKMKTFWINSAFRCFKDINNPNSYNRDALKDIIVKIKPYCQDVENGLFTVCKALYNVGVTVIVQNHLTLTQVRGGTFVVNNKPCIVLTDLNKRYTTIWETLIHELHHVLYDLDIIGKEGYHLTGEPDLFLIEDKAESFSLEYFCGFEGYKYIKPHILNHFIVQRFAKELEIDASFVYSCFRQYEQKLTGKNYYGAFTQYFPEYSASLKKLSPVTWKEKSIAEIAENIKIVFELNVK